MLIKTQEDSFVAGASGPAEIDSYEPGLRNWSLGGLRNDQKTKIKSALFKVLSEFGARRVFAPNVAPSSAVIVAQKRIMRGEEIYLDGGITLYRNSCLPADGTFLEVGDTFIMSAAGCPVIVATAAGKMIVAHAGRASLIDQQAIAGGHARAHYSVVHSIVDAFHQHGIAPHDIHMYVMFSIPKEDFVHHLNDMIYGERNAGIIGAIDSRWPKSVDEEKEGETTLCLETLVVEQAVEGGVVNITATNNLSEHPSLTHTRDLLPKDTRNLIIIKRTK